MNATNAQITVRAKGTTYYQDVPFSEAASAKMQKIVEKGGYHTATK